jgi:hypothetical protein
MRDGNLLPHEDVGMVGARGLEAEITSEPDAVIRVAYPRRRTTVTQRALVVVV